MRDWRAVATASALRSTRAPFVRGVALATVVCVITLLLVYGTARRVMVEHIDELPRADVSELRMGDLLVFGSVSGARQLVLELFQHGYASHVGLVVRDVGGDVFIWHITGRSSRPTLERLDDYLRTLVDGEFCITRAVSARVSVSDMRDAMHALADRRYSLTCVSHALRRFLHPFRRGSSSSSSSSLRSVSARLYCSQLVAETYVRVGVLKSAPLELMPVDLCECSSSLDFVDGVSLGRERLLRVR